MSLQLVVVGVGDDGIRRRHCIGDNGDGIVIVLIVRGGHLKVVAISAARLLIVLRLTVTIVAESRGPAGTRRHARTAAAEAQRAERQAVRMLRLMGGREGIDVVVWSTALTGRAAAHTGCASAGARPEVARQQVHDVQCVFYDVADVYI